MPKSKPNKFYILVYNGVDKKWHPFALTSFVRTFPNKGSATRALSTFKGNPKLRDFSIAECIVDVKGV